MNNDQCLLMFNHNSKLTSCRLPFVIFAMYKKRTPEFMFFLYTNHNTTPKHVFYSARALQSTFSHNNHIGEKKKTNKWKTLILNEILLLCFLNYVSMVGLLYHRICVSLVQFYVQLCVGVVDGQQQRRTWCCSGSWFQLHC